MTLIITTTSCSTLPDKHLLRQQRKAVSAIPLRRRYRDCLLPSRQGRDTVQVLWQAFDVLTRAAFKSEMNVSIALLERFRLLSDWITSARPDFSLSFCGRDLICGER